MRELALEFEDLLGKNGVLGVGLFWEYYFSSIFGILTE